MTTISAVEDPHIGNTMFHTRSKFRRVVSPLNGLSESIWRFPYTLLRQSGIFSRES
jgi:hypothetical protein